MKFRVSGTPIAAALLKLFEPESKRGRAIFSPRISGIDPGANFDPHRLMRTVYSGNPGKRGTEECKTCALLQRNIRGARKLESPLWAK